MNTQKFLKLYPDGKLCEVIFESRDTGDFDNHFNDFVHQQLECDIYEMADVSGTFRNIAMLVDEEGWFKTEVQANPIAWMFHSAMNPAFPIVGSVLFTGLCRVGELEELDFCGLGNEDIDNIRDHVRRIGRLLNVGGAI